jgi:hypothetical protein
MSEPGSRILRRAIVYYLEVAGEPFKGVEAVAALPLRVGFIAGFENPEVVRLVGVWSLVSY